MRWFDLPLQAPIEPFLAVAVGATEYLASACLGLAGAVGAQWKAYRNDDARSREELKRALETVHDTTTTYSQLLAVTNRLVEASGKSGEESRLFYDRVSRDLDTLVKGQARMVEAMEKRFRETG